MLTRKEEVKLNDKVINWAALMTIALLLIFTIGVNASKLDRYSLAEVGYSGKDIDKIQRLNAEYGIPVETLVMLYQPHEGKLDLAFEALKMYREAKELIMDSQGAIDSKTLGDTLALTPSQMTSLQSSDLSHEEITQLTILMRMLGQDIDSAIEEIKTRSKSDTFKEELGSTLGKVFSFPLAPRERKLKELEKSDVTIREPSSVTTSTFTTTIHDDPIYGMDEVSPFMKYFKNQNESINMDTGFLTYTVTDLVLPGRGGLDLVISRTYTNAMANLYKMGCERDEDYWEVVDEEGNVIESGITISYYSFTWPYTYFDERYGLGLGWRFNFPSIEHSDSGNTYLHLGNGTSYKYLDTVEWISNLENYHLTDMILTTDNSFSHNGRTSSHVLRYKDGLCYYFDWEGFLIGIKDRYGSTIRFEYNEYGLMSRIIDSVGRNVDFTYMGDTKVTLTCGTKTIEYNLESVEEESKYKLASVVYKDVNPGGVEPGDRTVLYSYSLLPATFSLYYSDGSSDSPASNKYLLLERITHPTGGNTFFEYEKYTKPADEDDSENLGWLETFRVKRRYDISNGVTYNSYLYEYGLQDESGRYNKRSTSSSDDTGYTELIDKSYFNSDHLLVRKETSGSDYKSTVVTHYKSDSKVPYREDIYKYAPDKVRSEVISRYFGYDIYRNLLIQTDTDGHETFNTYADDKYHVLTSSREKIDNSIFTGLERTNIDGYGRIVQERKKRIEKTDTVASPQSVSPIFSTEPLLNRSKAFWTWVTPIAVDHLDIAVYYYAAAPLQCVSYSIWIRAINSGEWTCLASAWHQAYLTGAKQGLEPYHFDMAEHAIYEVKVVANGIGGFGSWVKPMSVTAISDTTDIFTDLESVSISHEYDPTYLSNRIRTTIDGTESNINFVYDTTYNAYITRAYIEGVDNPYFNTYDEVVYNEVAYDFFGRVVRKWDGLGNESQYTYDKLDRIIREYHVTDGTDKNIRYYDSQNKVVIEDEEDSLTIFYYDQLSRPIKIYGDMDSIEGNGNEIKLGERAYNSMGRLLCETDGDGHSTYYHYDAIGRAIKIFHPDGTPSDLTDNPVTSIIYDDMANRRVTIDANGNISAVDMDNSGNIIRVY